MRNYFTSEGLLAEGQAALDAANVGQQEVNAAFESMPPMIARNPQEEEIFRRTMILAGQDEVTGRDQYYTPERAIYMQNKQQYEAQQALAKEAYVKKVNNPFFKATDFVTDLVRNTVGAPFNFLTDGAAFQLDPSKSALQGYKQKIQELSDLQEMNLEYFQTARTNRAKAFSESIAGIGNVNPSSFTPESIAEYNRTGDYGLLEPSQSYTPSHYTAESWSAFVDSDYSDPSLLRRWQQLKTHTDPETGEIYQIDQATGEKTVIRTADEALNLKINQWAELEFAKQQSVFQQNQTKSESSLRSARQATDILSTQIDKAIGIINQYPDHSTGWGALLNILPDTEAAQLEALMNTVKANVAFTALQDMRNNNPTGGALGNVSNIELELLYQSVAPLLQRGSAQELIAALETIRQDAVTTLEIHEAAYAEDLRWFGGRNNGAALFLPQDGGDGGDDGTGSTVTPEVQAILDELEELENSQVTP